MRVRDAVPQSGFSDNRARRTLNSGCNKLADVGSKRETGRSCQMTELGGRLETAAAAYFVSTDRSQMEARERPQFTLHDRPAVGICAHAAEALAGSWVDVVAEVGAR